MVWIGYLTGYMTARNGTFNPKPFGYEIEKKEHMDTIIITLKSLITPEAHEKLEEKLSEFLHKQRLSGTIDNTATGNMGTIIISLKSLITPEAHEKLEDALSEFLHEQGLSGTIDNTATGNTTQIKRRRK